MTYSQRLFFYKLEPPVRIHYKTQPFIKNHNLLIINKIKKSRFANTEAKKLIDSPGKTCSFRLESVRLQSQYAEVNYLYYRYWDHRY